jgi:TRAP-type C4-dicarboxylate transport system substrate-binding protein
MLEELGATAVGMPVPAVPESLSKGVIDGVAIPWEVTVALKVPELVNSHTEFSGDHGLYTATFVLAMNQASYDRLPDDLKAVIDANAGIEVAAMFGRAMDEGDVVGRRLAEERGNTIVRLDAAETERWQAASAVIVERWIAEMEGQGIPGGELVEQARALIARHSGS